MQTFLKNAWTIFQKDIRLEKRTRESFSAMFVFAVLVLVTFNFTMTPDKEQILQLGPGILWVAFTFAGTLGLNRAFAAESENGNFQALMMLPIDKSSIYLGKLFSGLLFMLLMEVFVIPLFVVFFNLTLWSEIPWLLAICILGTLGFVATGTVFSAIAQNTRMREVLLPILLFPVAVPAIIASVEATGVILRHEPMADLIDWVKILAGYDIIIMTASLVTFEYVIED